MVKLRTAAHGLRARTKLAAQTAIALAAALAIFHVHRDAGVDFALRLPLVGGQLELGWLFVPLATVVIVGSSNAANLADGLDGLAGGCLVCASGALAAVVYAAGHASWAGYLGIAHVEGAGEMLVVAAATIGSLLGFLWFNCHPASVFMGDTGSLPLGGLLGLLAVIARQELLLAIIGGVFVVEAISVIVQVASFRALGMRVFRCALASSFSIGRLARGQDRGALLDRSRAVRAGGAGGAEDAHGSPVTDALGRGNARTERNSTLASG